MRTALGQLGRVPADTAVIWAGVKGNAEYVQRCAERGFSAERVGPEIHHPRDYRRWVCQFLGIEDHGMEVNAACASSTVALALGMQMIAQGECSYALICAADIVCRFTFTGFAALKALSPTCCRPFDVQRDGLCLGDGAAAMLLADPAVVPTSEETGHPVDRPHVRLTGWGISNDANHITGPARDGSGLTDAIRQALHGADISSADLAAWCTHGTGTIYNDAMEVTALEEIFASRRFPIFSIKGAVGHTLGAAGVLEAALCVKSLRERTVPPTAAMREPEPRAVGRASNECQELRGNRILTTNSGFGGVNAALVLELP
jgi:3-oxoacyl-[acyl-carrier-protein] synthase II